MKLYMAPVRGISDLVYRNCFCRHFTGIDVAITPFMTTVKGNQVKPFHLTQYDPERNLLAIIPQIIGKNPEHFIDLCKLVSDLGNSSVNWNLGCPYPTMTRKKCGSGLLPHADMIRSFLDTVCQSISLNLSIKVRLGLDSPDDLLHIMPLFNQYPLKEIIIHPRLGTQQYKGNVDLDGFGQCLALSSHPIVYNGDITTQQNFVALKERFPGVAGWMLGRGLFTNPFLAESIKRSCCCSVAEQMGKLRAFHDDLYAGYAAVLSGFSHLHQRMMSHWEYLSATIPKGKTFYKKLKKVKTADAYAYILNQYIAVSSKPQTIITHPTIRGI